MVFFGPLSSVFDFVTFGVMLWVFHSGPVQFRTAWFVESLATQTLVIFAIRTRRIPFFRSHPSLPMAMATLGVATVGAVLPATPLAHALDFAPLPSLFFAVLIGMIIGYLIVIEIGKRVFFGASQIVPEERPRYSQQRHLRRRAAYFSGSTRVRPRVGATGRGRRRRLAERRPTDGDRPLVTREHVSDLAVSHVAAGKARETWEPM